MQQRLKKWRRFAFSRLLRLVLVLAALVVVTFGMVQVVPGDPARTIAGAQADQAAVDSARKEFGLDQPVLTQFGNYVSGLARGSLGKSFESRSPVTTVISEKIGPTAQLAIGGLLIIVFIGVPVGLIGGAASRTGKPWVEVLFSAVTGAFAAVPHYLTATFLVFLFAVTWQIFPVAGAGSLLAVVLPAIAIAVRPATMVSRVVRVRTLEVLEQPYVRTARSKRLKPMKLYFRHVLPNAVTTALALGGTLFAGLIGGAIIVEQVFARPGLGTSLVNGILIGDYPVVQGIVLVLGVSVVLVNTFVDVILAILDPQTLET